MAGETRTLSGAQIMSSSTACAIDEASIRRVMTLLVMPYVARQTMASNVQVSHDIYGFTTVHDRIAAHRRGKFKERRTPPTGTSL
jgi:hypothetical protein